MLKATLDQLASAARSSKARQVHEIPVGDIDPDPDQPRKTFEGLDDLAGSIVAIGIKQPLLVRQHPEHRERYLLIAGERRLRAAKRAGLLKVPCLVETGEAEKPGRLAITQLTENLQRQDVPILETAQALQRALDATELSKGDLARALGKKASFVSKHLALLQAAGPARQALEEGLLLSAETYRLFTRLPEANRRNLLTQARLSEQPITRSQVAGSSTPARADVRPKPRPAGTRVRSTSTKRSNTELRLRLSVDQVRTIIRRFDVDPPPEPSKLKAKLLELLR